MTKYIGYIRRRVGTLTPGQQRESLIQYGVPEYKNKKHSPIYSDLDEALRPTALRKGYRLVVWDIGVIGMGQIDKAFVGVGECGGEGIYDINNKKFYPCHGEADKKHADARAAIIKFNSRVRTEGDGDKGGRPFSKARLKRSDIASLFKGGMHETDIVAKYEKTKFKTSLSTINRILKAEGLK